MSCMYLSKNHYQFIADSLYRVTVQYDRSMLFRFTRTTFGDHLARDRETNIVKFVQELQRWNSQAYAERYHEAELKPELAMLIGPLGGDGNVDVAMLLKALRCVDYQCSETQAYEDSEDKKTIVQIIADCESCLIEELPAYREAPWSIE